MMRVYLILLLLLLQVRVFAQQTKISGTIVDAKTKSVLVGVTILEKGTYNGVFTDSIGNFTITVASPDATLTCSVVGYKSLEYALSGDKSLKLTMEKDLGKDNKVMIQVRENVNLRFAMIDLVGFEDCLSSHILSKETEEVYQKFNVYLRSSKEKKIIPIQFYSYNS